MGDSSLPGEFTALAQICASSDVLLSNIEAINFLVKHVAEQCSVNNKRQDTENILISSWKFSVAVLYVHFLSTADNTNY